jgi:hypothetical protein
MRIRHLVLVVLGIAAAALAVQVAAPGSAQPTVLLDDGTINVTAGEDGRGAWVPYTLTVRNLGDHDFSGRLLLLKKIVSKATALPRIGVPGVGKLVSPVGAGGQANPPDAAFQFPVALSPRHKKTYTFFAPDDFISVVVQDPNGRQVAEGQVDDRKSVAVGALTDSATLAGEIEPIRLGDLTMKVTQWNDGNPFPDRAAYLSGYSTIVLGHFDSGRLGAAQISALSEFVGLGGELVVAGGSDLARASQSLPPQLVAFYAGGPSAVDSLAPVADLSGVATDLAAPIAGGTVAAGATVILESAAGRPLEVERTYGSGRVVELLFDPDSPAGAASPIGLSSLALAQAIARGLESIPGTQPAGRTLVDAGELPGVLFPKPSDSPFPPLWLVGGLLAIYLLLVVPANYLLVRRLGSPGLFWATTPALAVIFTMFSYLIGQGLQSGVRDQEIQFYRVGPEGVVSRVDVHGIVFPTRGDHQVSFGSDSLVAPYTIAFPELSPFCLSCAFPGTSGTLVEEHVLNGGSPTIAERGLVYGSVRVVGSASAGTGDLSLAAHLASVSNRISGSIANTGKVPVSGLLVYTYYQGAYRAAFLARGLAPGESVQVDSAFTAIGDAAPNLPPGTRLTTGQAISLIADEAGRRNLSHNGQLAIVGFVKPVDSNLRVDGSPPGGQVVAAFGMPVDVESAQGRLGDVALARLASSYLVAGTGFNDAYDIAIPAAKGSLILRYDKRLYSAVAVYDWTARTWRQGDFSSDPTTPLVMLTQLNPGEVRDGLVRVRATEVNLTWGSDITVRFAGEVP